MLSLTQILRSKGFLTETEDDTTTGVVQQLSSLEFHTNNDHDVPPYYRICTRNNNTSEDGRILVAKVAIPQQVVIHTAPCIFVSRWEYEAHLCHTVFKNYLLVNNHRNSHHHDHSRLLILSLGHGSLFGRIQDGEDSTAAAAINVEYTVDVEGMAIQFRTCRAVEAGEELCVHVGGGGGGGSTLCSGSNNGTTTGTERGGDVDDSLGIDESMSDDDGDMLANEFSGRMVL